MNPLTLFKRKKDTWALTNTLMELNQLRMKALDLNRIAEVRRYNQLIAIAQIELLEAKS